VGKYEFIRENSHWHKVVSLITLITIILIILLISIFFWAVFYSVIIAIPFTAQILASIKNNIANSTIIGLFWANLLGGIFIVPSPDEVIFYYALVKGNSYILSIIWAITGYMIAQVFNYFLGRKVSNMILNFVSKKKVYSARRLASRYGAWGIIIFNLLPLPGPLLTFALGIAKYNFTRLMLLTILGKTAKYAALILIHWLL
jgi:membrane protein YqaA with SNARE-associated domain